MDTNLHSHLKASMKIGTHNGTFHCDEVLACCMLSYVTPEYENATIVRTRDKEILDQCDIIVDVGGEYDPKHNRYDHHQRSFNASMHSLKSDYPWTIKLSSAGLVYFHFGHRIISKILNLPVQSEATDSLFTKIYENFIQEIDAIDNGIEVADGLSCRYHISTNLSSRVKRLNQPWNDKTLSEEECFEKAKQLVNKEFLEIVESYGKVWLPARDTVKAAVLQRNSVHPGGEIVEFNEGGCPWKEHLFQLEECLKLEVPIKFVIYPDGSQTWRVQCVSLTCHSFENRVPLKEEWCGLRDEELSKVSGIPNCVFVHMNGFIGGNKSREGAIEMALQSLDQQSNKKICIGTF